MFGMEEEKKDNKEKEKEKENENENEDIKRCEKKEMKKMEGEDKAKGEDKKIEDVRGREGVKKMDGKKENKKIDEDKNIKGNTKFKEEDKSLKSKANNELDVLDSKKQETKITSIEKITVKTKDSKDNIYNKNIVGEEKKSLKLNVENRKGGGFKEDNKDRSKILKEVEDDKKDKNKQIIKAVEEKKDRNKQMIKVIEEKKEKNQDYKSGKTIEKNKKLQEDKKVEKPKTSTKIQQEDLKNNKIKPEIKVKTNVTIGKQQEKPKKLFPQEIEKFDSENLDTAETPKIKASIKSLKAKSQSLENQKNSKTSEKPDKNPKISTKSTKPINKARIKKKSSKSSEKSISSSEDNQESSENDYESDGIKEIIEEISSDEDMEESSEISSEQQKSLENSPHLDPSLKIQTSKILKKSQNPTSKTPNLTIKTESIVPNPNSLEDLLSTPSIIPQKQIIIAKSSLQSKNSKRIKSKKNTKKGSKTRKKHPKKVQLYSVEGQDVVISIMNEDKKSSEFPQIDENPTTQIDPQSSNNLLENSLSLLSPTSETPKPSHLSSQGTLVTTSRSSTKDHNNLLDFKRNSSKILNFPSKGLKKDPIKSFISNFSIALLETINQIAKNQPKKLIKPFIDTSKSFSQSYDPSITPTSPASPSFQQLEKALNALKIDNDYEDEGKDSVNNLPQDYIPKLYTSYSLLIPNNKPENIPSSLTQRPTLISSPTKLSDKYKNISKFYSKKTEYEKIPSLLSKFSTIQKVPTNGTLKNAHSDSSDSDNLTSSLYSESESIDYRRSDYMKHSALYEVENFELIKNLANTIYGANFFDMSGNNSKTPSARGSILALSEEVVKVLKDCEEGKGEENNEERGKVESFEKEVDRNELNIMFEQNNERYLFFKQDSINFKVPKMEFNTEKLVIENGLDFDNKRRIELKNQFLTSRPYFSDSDESEECTFIKIIPAEENIADKLKFDKKSIQRALQRKKSYPKQPYLAMIK
ncbi:hypothetical protein SteCoe_3897 [Stentor coeruleus]|uniref:Uncharacterized protein n=1 Tax=Stentor coeruleus TaxID=5963 RepID=A0A1R2CW13_9CILI|nr:hypothetical protein SteCoe_3897 [Stentor coeruleus]